MIPAEIAKRLTPAQRYALLSFLPHVRKRNFVQFSHEDAQLQREGLIRTQELDAELTPLGLAVREELKKEEKNG